MWLIRFKVFHEDCAFSPLCKKYSVSDFIYLLGFNTKEKKFQWTNAHLLNGKDENISDFVKELKKSKKIKKLEVIKNYMISLEEANKKDYAVFSPLFSKEIFYTQPIMIKPEGFEYWCLASWNREVLMKAFSASKHFGSSELLEIKQTKIDSIFLPHINPGLTEKQMKAIKMAISKGYYQFPKKTNLQKLAKESEVAKETFFEHLQKAESKILSFLTGNL